MCGQVRVGKDVVLTMVLIENVLALLLMIEQLDRKPTIVLAMATAKQQSNTVLGVAVECGLIFATIITMIDISQVSKQHNQHVGRPGQYNK